MSLAAESEAESGMQLASAQVESSLQISPPPKYSRRYAGSPLYLGPHTMKRSPAKFDIKRKREERLWKTSPGSPPTLLRLCPGASDGERRLHVRGSAKPHHLPSQAELFTFCACATLQKSFTFASLPTSLVLFRQSLLSRILIIKGQRRWRSALTSKGARSTTSQLRWPVTCI